MSFVCDECRRRSRERAQVTVTGRHLCPACHDRLLGAAAGLLADGGVGGAIATAGWFRRIRATRTAAARRRRAGPAVPQRDADRSG
jgi:hypothetical protein